MGLQVGAQKLRQARPSGVPWRALECTGLPEAGQTQGRSKSLLLRLEEWGLLCLTPTLAPESTVALNLCPAGLMRLKPAEKLKPVPQRMGSPLLCPSRPAQETVAVSAEARAHGQPTGFQPGKKQGPEFLPGDKEPDPGYPCSAASPPRPSLS